MKNLKTKNLFWGLFFIVAAGVIVVNQLGYLAGITTLNLVITIFLIPIIIQSIVRANFFGVFFSIAILGILFASELGITSLVPIPILATALFLSIGCSLVFGRHKKYFDKCSFVHVGNEHIDHEHFDEIVNTEDNDVVDFGVKFGSSVKYVNSKNLKQANFYCSFGALKVYLDNATLDPEGAVINVDFSFSGVEIYIPKEWKVLNGIESTLSGVEEKYNRYEHTGPTVKLTGKASLSGIEIIYI